MYLGRLITCGDTNLRGCLALEIGGKLIHRLISPDLQFQCRHTHKKTKQPLDKEKKWVWEGQAAAQSSSQEIWSRVRGRIDHPLGQMVE